MKKGSPPRVRERPSSSSQKLYASRITPACAGKTITIFLLIPLLRDHPRVCGKDPSGPAYMMSSWGSPPRVRERRHCTNTICSCSWITPACAGKTSPKLRARHLTRDHPRVCGKDASGAPTGMCSAGSPPRVRERPEEAGEAAYWGRITPACAGKTGSIDCID